MLRRFQILALAGLVPILMSACQITPQETGIIASQPLDDMVQQQMDQLENDPEYAPLFKQRAYQKILEKTSQDAAYKDHNHAKLVITRLAEIWAIHRHQENTLKQALTRDPYDFVKWENLISTQLWLREPEKAAQTRKDMLSVFYADKDKYTYNGRSFLAREFFYVRDARMFETSKIDVDGYEGYANGRFMGQSREVEVLYRFELTHPQDGPIAIILFAANELTNKIAHIRGALPDNDTTYFARIYYPKATGYSSLITLYTSPVRPKFETARDIVINYIKGRPLDTKVVQARK